MRRDEPGPGPLFGRAFVLPTDVFLPATPDERCRIGAPSDGEQRRRPGLSHTEPASDSLNLLNLGDIDSRRFR